MSNMIRKKRRSRPFYLQTKIKSEFSKKKMCLKKINFWNYANMMKNVCNFFFKCQDKKIKIFQFQFEIGNV